MPRPTLQLTRQFVQQQLSLSNLPVYSLLVYETRFSYYIYYIYRVIQWRFPAVGLSPAIGSPQLLNCSGKSKARRMRKRPSSREAGVTRLKSARLVKCSAMYSDCPHLISSIINNIPECKMTIINTKHVRRTALLVYRITSD